MLLGPVVSTWSDRHRGRWGRRIPYLLVPTPVVVASIAAHGVHARSSAWRCTRSSAPTRPACARCSLIMFAVFWTISEVARHHRAIPLLRADQRRRPQGSRRPLLRPVPRGEPARRGSRSTSGSSATPKPTTRAIFLGLAVLYAVGFTLMCLMVKEGQYPPPPEPLPRRPANRPARSRRSSPTSAKASQPALRLDLRRDDAGRAGVRAGQLLRRALRQEHRPGHGALRQIPRADVRDLLRPLLPARRPRRPLSPAARRHRRRSSSTPPSRSGAASSPRRRRPSPSRSSAHGVVSGALLHRAGPDLPAAAARATSSASSTPPATCWSAWAS